MAAPDDKFWDLLADEPRRDLLRILVRERHGLTQRELVQITGLNSSTVSRRMGELEHAGLVTRQSSHGAYELTFAEATRIALAGVLGLRILTLRRDLDEAALLERDLGAPGDE